MTEKYSLSVNDKSLYLAVCNLDNIEDYTFPLSKFTEEERGHIFSLVNNTSKCRGCKLMPYINMEVIPRSWCCLTRKIMYLQFEKMEKETIKVLREAQEQNNLYQSTIQEIEGHNRNTILSADQMSVVLKELRGVSKQIHSVLDQQNKTLDRIAESIKIK